MPARSSAGSGRFGCWPGRKPFRPDQGGSGPDPRPRPARPRTVAGPWRGCRHPREASIPPPARRIPAAGAWPVEAPGPGAAGHPREASIHPPVGGIPAVGPAGSKCRTRARSPAAPRKVDSSARGRLPRCRSLPDPGPGPGCGRQPRVSKLLPPMYTSLLGPCPVEAQRSSSAGRPREASVHLPAGGFPADGHCPIQAQGSGAAGWPPPARPKTGGRDGLSRCSAAHRRRPARPARWPPGGDPPAPREGRAAAARGRLRWRRRRRDGGAAPGIAAPGQEPPLSRAGFPARARGRGGLAASGTGAATLFEADRWSATATSDSTRGPPARTLALPPDPAGRGDRPAPGRCGSGGCPPAPRCPSNPASPRSTTRRVAEPGFRPGPGDGVGWRHRAPGPRPCSRRIGRARRRRRTPPPAALPHCPQPPDPARRGA